MQSCHEPKVRFTSSKASATRNQYDFSKSFVVKLKFEFCHPQRHLPVSAQSVRINSRRLQPSCLYIGCNRLWAVAKHPLRFQRTGETATSRSLWSTQAFITSRQVGRDRLSFRLKFSRDVVHTHARCRQPRGRSRVVDKPDNPRPVSRLATFRVPTFGGTLGGADGEQVGRESGGGWRNSRVYTSATRGYP